jgi:hypothetical protein
MSAPTTSASLPFNIAPLGNAMQAMFNEVGLRDTIKTGIDFLDSSALVNVTLTSLKTVPYTFFSGSALFEQFDNGLSVRLRYAEVAFTSAAATVYNLALALVCTLATVVTFGQVQMVKDQMKKHWIHTALAAASVGIATVGTVSPEHGVKANAALLVFGAQGLFKSVETNLIANLGAAYQTHSTALKAAVVEVCGGDRDEAESAFGNVFRVLDRRLNADVQTVAELADVFERVHTAEPEFAHAMLLLLAAQVQQQVLGMANA